MHGTFPPDLSATPWRLMLLSARLDIWTLVDAEDHGWLVEKGWNYGWHAKTKWKFYAKRNTGTARSTVYMHREILQRFAPLPPHLLAVRHGDHINGQSLDNRRCNLRWLTPEENSRHRVPREQIPPIDTIVRELLQAAPQLAEVPFP